MQIWLIDLSPLGAQEVATMTTSCAGSDENLVMKTSGAAIDENNDTSFLFDTFHYSKWRKFS